MTEPDGCGLLSCIQVDTIAMHKKKIKLNIQQHEDEPANAALIRAGFLMCSPVDPTIGI